MADGALVGVGRDDRDLAHPVERLLERQQAARLDAVVVGDEDLGQAGPFAERPGVDPERARPPRAAPPASGSPRSLSRSRRSVRARSRVMSGTSSAASRRVRRRSSLMSGRRRDRRGVVVGARGRGCRPAARRIARAGGPSPPPDAASAGRSTAATGAGSVAGLVDVGGAAGRRLARDPDRLAVTFLEPASGPPRDRPVARRAVQELEREGRHDRRDRDPEDRPGDARDPAADEHRAEDHDRVDPDRALHDPRLQDVHHDEPAGAHQDDRRHTASGCRTRATMTGGAHDTNGPKNGIVWSTPAATEVSAAKGRPEQQVGAERDQEVDDAHQRLAAQEAAERARDGCLQETRLLRVGRRHDPEQEGQHGVAVEDHVDRQEEHDQQRPHDAEAGHRDLLERGDERGRDRVEVAQGRLRLGDEVDLVEPDRVQPLLPRAEDRRQAGLDVRDGFGELPDRGGQRAGRDDDDQNEDQHDRGVDQHRGGRPRQARDRVDDPGDDRADDEREEPGQEERQEDVAEVEEQQAELLDDEEEDRDHGQDEQRAQQSTITRSRLAGQHGISAGPSSPGLRPWSPRRSGGCARPRRRGSRRRSSGRPSAPCSARGHPRSAR